MIRDANGLRRIGTFRLTWPVLENPPEALAALDGVIVFRAEALYAFACVEYVGSHQAFDGIEEGFEAVRYDVQIVGGRRVFTRRS